MPKQVERRRENNRAKRDRRVAKALDTGIVDALDADGIELMGIAFKGDTFSCLMTIKGVIAGVRSVCFVGSDSMINCVLKAYSDARNDRLTWRPDKYRI